MACQDESDAPISVPGRGTTRMILTCPSCRTRYQSESARFVPPGRNVRCAKCGQVWFQPAPAPEPEPEPMREPEPESALQSAPAVAANVSPPAMSIGTQAMRASKEEVQRPRRRSRSSTLVQTSGWAALVLLAVSVGWSSVQFRQDIADMWPQSASLYAALGMPVSANGITISNIAYQQEVEDGQPVLAVSGKVVNVGDRELPVPVIRVVLTDGAKNEIYHWTFDVGVPSLKPGAESPFVTRLASPPPEARNLNIRFAQAGDSQ